VTSVRLPAAALCAALIVGGCSGDGGGVATSTTTAGADSGGATASSAPVTVEGLAEFDAGGLDGVVLARALVQGVDLPGFEERSVVRPYQADEREGLLVCGQDLRAETGLVQGVQSVLVSEAVQVTVTVSAAADSEEAARFVERFDEVAGGCAAPWTQEAPLLGVGPIEAEVVGEADVAAPGPQVRAFRLRTRTEAGTSDVVAAVIAVGPLLTTVTVAGPAGDELPVATDAVAAAYRRSVELARQLE
jgi:hypothetical protein